jgi:hypothetical protein
MATRRIVMINVADLRPHPQNAAVYGPPTANSAYKDIKFRMQRDGFDERFPLFVTEDRRIVHGVTRWHCAKACKIEEVPCEVFQPNDPATAELEMEHQMLLGNIQRQKTQLIIAREQRKALEIETALARQRMAGGNTDGGPSKATDRVGKVFKESGKTVQRRIKILDAIEEAQEGNAAERKKAEQLLGLLESHHTVKALDLIDGKADKPKPARKADVPRTLHDYATKAYSEFYEACCKVHVSAEADILQAAIQRMQDDLKTARQRLDEM